MSRPKSVVPVYRKHSSGKHESRSTVVTIFSVPTAPKPASGNMTD